MAARAVGDQRRLDEIVEVLQVTATQYKGGPRERLYTDIERLTFHVEPEELVSAALAGPHSVERWLSQANDAKLFIGDQSMQSILATATHQSALPLRVQSLRAIGLSQTDAGVLQEARSLAERIGMRPTVARLDCEIGRLTADGARIEAGRRLLREIGDLVALDRYE
jgi:hypothetical protein